MKKKVSLKDIAQKLGVSTALVSYVLNNQKEGRIGKEIAAKIRDTAASLNYRANLIARSLKTNRTNTIGLIVADISNPFFSSLASIIETEAEKRGYTVIFGSSHEDGSRFEKLVDTFLNRQVDGLIIAPPANSEKQIQEILKQDTPLVLVDRYHPSLNTSFVTLNNFQASADAVSHLVKSGRKRIGMITYETTLFHITDRKSGFLETLKKNGLPADETLVKEIAMDNRREDVEKAVEELLRGDSPVDALLFATNRISDCAVKYINSLGIKVPESLALVGFDEAESLDLFHAPLTYIRQPLQKMGDMVTGMLVDQMNGTSTISQKVLHGELIVRKSTGSPDTVN
ncbi:MAG: LacI family DNA-binding transcriptional regulator [Gemmatimonadaceae bacterium]|nr:LacI family DNA-binding transcriptional regulator [Chitinophagaceae bacterium]